MLVQISQQPRAGQQQLFCLGAALLRTNARIQVLDEATSSMDLKVDRMVREVIWMEFNEKIIVTVAHPLESIVGSKLLIVLDEGKK